MTGAYVKILKNGKYEPIENDQLTDKEMDDFLFGMHRERLKKWVRFLAAWIRDNVKESTG